MNTSFRKQVSYIQEHLPACTAARDVISYVRMWICLQFCRCISSHNCSMHVYTFISAWCHLIRLLNSSNAISIYQVHNKGTGNLQLWWIKHYDIDGLVQDCSYFIEIASELLQSCTKPIVLVCISCVISNIEPYIVWCLSSGVLFVPVDTVLNRCFTNLLFRNFFL